jgi:hypothetical protein
MTEHPTSPEPATSPEGRESNGRFAKGNAGGPGNPFARSTAALRATLQRKVTDRDIEEIADRLIADAKNGDKAATKLLFQYVIGKPQPATNPDTLDVDELRGLQAEAVPPEVFAAMLRCVPLALLLELWPLLIEAKTKEAAAQVQETCARADEKDQRRADHAATKAERRRRRREKREQARQAKRAAAAPSTNGSNGRPAAADGEVAPSTNGDIGGIGLLDGQQPPSTNGDDGADALAILLRWLRGQHRPSDGHAEG